MLPIRIGKAGLLHGATGACLPGYLMDYRIFPEGPILGIPILGRVAVGQRFIEIHGTLLFKVDALYL